MAHTVVTAVLIDVGAHAGPLDIEVFEPDVAHRTPDDPLAFSRRSALVASYYAQFQGRDGDGPLLGWDITYHPPPLGSPALS